MRCGEVAGAFPKGASHRDKKIFWQVRYKDLTVAQTAQYSPKSQENGEFGKSGIVQMETAFCCDQVLLNVSPVAMGTSNVIQQIWNNHDGD